MGLDPGRWTANPLRWTVRARITATATVLVGLVLTAGAIALVVTHDRQLRANLDDALTVRAETMALEVATGELRLVDSAAGDDRLAQAVAGDGRIIGASPGLPPDEPLAEPPPDGPIVRDVRLEPPGENELETYRILSRRLDTSSGEVILHVGESTEDIDDSARALAVSLSTAVPLTVVVLGVLVWWLVGRTLRPVEAIRAEVADIGARDLHRRVPRPPTDDEIARLATTMNAMLDRLEESSIRQQRFVADASHELRSPLTRIRTELEVAAAHGPDSDLDGLLDRVLDETTELERLVADLLHLARSDAGSVPTTRQPVDLDDIAFREVRRLRAAGHSVDIEGLSAAQVVGDPDQLTRLVRNLLDNAARHATSLVTVTLTDAGGRARLVVADDGPGIEPGDRERIFERFARLDDARTRDHGGTGLGLAIARDIVEAHGGTIEVADSRRPGATFVVTMPASAT